MLVTEALNELKTLDSRINREIDKAHFVAAAKLCETKVNPYTTKDDFSNDAKAAWQSINDLIKNKENIKAAVVLSNAVTYIEVDGIKMTVAAAIELKSSIEYQRDLLLKMKKERDNALRTMNTANIAMEDQINRLLETACGKDTTVKSENYSSIAVPYKANNEYGLVDPLRIEEKIEEMEKRIEGFLSNVDSVLQISNCITEIKLPD